MNVSLMSNDLIRYVGNQLAFFYPDAVPLKLLCRYIDEVLDRVEVSFSAVNNKYFNINGETYFNHLHTDQYSMFLYFLSNTLYKAGVDPELCTKLFYLNKLLHGIDVFYCVELPSIFLFSHPLGTILGRAQYSDYFIVYQNCTVGSSHDIDDYPNLGKYVSLYAGSSVLGACNIGNNCKIAAHSLIMDQNLPPNRIYIGTPNNCLIKKNKYHDRVWDPKS